MDQPVDERLRGYPDRLDFRCYLHVREWAREEDFEVFRFAYNRLREASNHAERKRMMKGLQGALKIAAFLAKL